MVSCPPGRHHNGCMAVCVLGHTYLRLHVAGIQKICLDISGKIQKQHYINKNHVNFVMVSFLVYINQFFNFNFSISVS